MQGRNIKLRKEHARSGQALIEMALVITVLLFLTLGLVQYGLLANARVTLANLAREGVRYAAVHATETNSDTAIKNYVVQRADSTPLTDIAAADVTITPALASRASGQMVTVAIAYNLRRKFILPASFPGLNRIGTSTTVSASMLIE